VVIAVIGATAYFAGVAYRLAVVTVGIGAAACAYYWPVGRRARGAFGLASRVIPSHLPRQLLGNAAGTVGLPARANLGI
jgi:hypothetical protein